jgi:hypothetical protein
VFDNPHYPDESGALGVTGKVGIVIRRETGAYSPRARLTVLTTKQKLGGYVPAATITGATDNGGDEWELFLDTSLFPPGSDDRDWWPVGSRVRAVELGTQTATVVAGEVINFSALGDIDVAFDGVWGGPASGTGWWYLTFADADDASLADAQKRFAFIADSDGYVQFASGASPAFRFGP